MILAYETELVPHPPNHELAWICKERVLPIYDQTDPQRSLHFRRILGLTIFELVYTAENVLPKVQDQGSVHDM